MSHGRVGSIPFMSTFRPVATVALNKKESLASLTQLFGNLYIF